MRNIIYAFNVINFSVIYTVKRFIYIDFNFKYFFISHQYFFFTYLPCTDADPFVFYYKYRFHTLCLSIHTLLKCLRIYKQKNVNEFPDE